MGVQFFKKNRIDLDRAAVVITATDLVATSNGQSFVDLVRNRNNTSGWMTTGSTDAAGSELLIEMPDRQDLDSILFVKHNFKSFTVQYWDGDSWEDFSTPIAETVNAKTTNCFRFDQITTAKIKIHISATQVANADKSICQVILTEILGELNVKPILKPVVDKGRKATRYLSGKRHITKSIASFAVDVMMNNVVNDDDLTLAETLYDTPDGFLVWICGGDISQYPNQRLGYRLEDIYLMNPTNEYEPAYEDGYHRHGIPIALKLVEVN